MANHERIIVIGVDFGTTFSGVAWAINAAAPPNEVDHISSWPNVNDSNRVSDKVPTCLRPIDNNPNQMQWGFLVPGSAPSSEVFRLFKLKLDTRPSVEDLTSEKLYGYTDVEVDQLIVSYLSLLGNYLTQHLKDQYGEGFVTSSQLQFVLTVPAIWSERATQRTRQAFERAMGPVITRPVTVISEPEAAANCVLQRANSRILREGECFMIVDAGGGTVDLISYVLRRLHPLEVDEAVPGSGDICGGATVTERFKAWLVSRVEGEEYFDDDVLHDAAEAFDTQIKPGVSSAALASNRSFSVPVPGLYDNSNIGIRNERMEVSAGEIITFFRPSIERIKLLVAEQIAASNVPVASIILVGGYGQSTYLREELEADEMVQQRRIRVHQPIEAWTAVVEGAVMRGLQEVAPDAIDTRRMRWNRRARKHYGTELTVTYNAARHSELINKRRWDGMTGSYEVDVMSWFINKGETVNEAQPYFKDFLMTCRVNHGKPRTIFLIVYADEHSEVAPMSRTDNVHELCTVEADLRQIPEAQIRQTRGIDGFMYYLIEGQIEAVYGSASTMYTLIYHGQRYNTVTAEYV